MPTAGSGKRWILPTFIVGIIIAGTAVWNAIQWSQRDRLTGLVAEAQAAYEHHDWATAQIKAREQLKKNRDDPRALRILGRALSRQGRDQDAALIFERLGRDSMAAEDYLLVGQGLVRARNLDMAIDIWKMALQLDLAHFESRIALEQVLFRLDRLEDAEKHVESLRLQPERGALAQVLLGQIRTQQFDIAGAARAFTLALERPDQWKFMADPDLIRKQLARCQLQLGKPDLAREQVRQLAGPESDQETCWLLSRCDLQESLASQANVLIKAALAENHSSLELKAGAICR